MDESKNISGVNCFESRSNKFYGWVVFFVAALVSAHGPIAAHAAQWDQQKVAEIAGQVNTMLEEIVSDPATTKEQDVPLQRKKHNAALVDLQSLNEYVTELAAALKQGRGREQTWALYRKITTLRKSVRDYAQDLTIAEVVRNKAQATRALLDELDAFYQQP